MNSLHKGPSICNFGLVFFLTGTHWFWTGTHNFVQDESKDLPMFGGGVHIFLGYNLISFFMQIYFFPRGTVKVPIIFFYSPGVSSYLVGPTGVPVVLQWGLFPRLAVPRPWERM